MKRKTSCRKGWTLPANRLSIAAATTRRRPPDANGRQFTNSYEGLSSQAMELAQAIDAYKLRHRRRFITYEEMLTVLDSLGYRK